MKRTLKNFDFANINPDVLRKEYYHSGALVIRNLLSEKELDQSLTFLQKLLQLKYPARPCSNAVDKAASVSAHLTHAMNIDSNAQSILYDIMARSEATHTLSTNHKILGVIKVLLSDTFSIHEKKILLMSPPYEEWHLARWHQDHYYNGGPENSCTVYAPLQKTNLVNGGLSIALGAHLNGCIAHDSKESNNKWNTIAAKRIEAFPDVCEIQLEKGDVLFLHSLVPHTANVNQTDMVRFVANFRYQDLSNEDFIGKGWRIENLEEARRALGRKNV